MLESDWDPWRHVETLPDVAVFRARLPRAVRGSIRRRRGLSVIVLNRRRGRLAQRCALTEELIHHERRVGDRILLGGDRRDPLNLREEHAVHRLAMERHIPASAVLAILHELRASGECNYWQWAEDLDVPVRMLFARLADVGRRIGSVRPRWHEHAAPGPLSAPLPGSLREYRLTAPIAIYRQLARAM